MAKIRLAIAGLGNCASSLIQGFEYYKNVDENAPTVPGLMHNVLGGYKISDIELVAVFDVDKRKVGKDVSEAVFSEPNCTIKFSDVKKTNVIVKKGPVLDGVGDTTKDSFLIDEAQKPVDVAEELKKAKAEILVSYMPVGSEQATRYYAQAALDANCAFVNAMPVFIASEKEWSDKFKAKGLPCIGDDIKSQVGATIVHRTLAKLFVDRGVKLEHTYQLNFGGNTDFKNMLERKRLKSKKLSKTESVQSQIPGRMADDDIHIGPSDYVPWMHDKKVAFIRLEGKNFGNVPLVIECRLDVEDSPNSAGVIIDAIRCAKLGLDRKIAGALLSPSSYFMKHPMEQYSDEEARKRLEEFIAGKRER